MKTSTNNLATKDDLNKVRIELKRDIWKLDEKIDDVKFGLEQKMTQFKSEIMDGVDKIYKELKDMRQEQTMHQGVHDRVEERLNKVEEKIGIAPQ